VEFPIPDFLPLIQKIKEENGTVIYDLLDDWQTSLGGQWYSEARDKEIIKTSDILLATAPRLQDHLSNISQRRVTLIPNAVNDSVFNPGIDYPKPKDMPKADRVFIYVGALWGEWFDWTLLGEIASQNHAAAVCIIGDYRGQYGNLPSNIYFLGLKPQTDLPAYLYHSDVAIIPWIVNKITQATSPLKVYEYLAMNLPVVAPSLETLKNVPGVMLARDHQEFIHLVSQANKTPKPANDNRTFIRNNNWRSRVIDILALVNEQNFDERNNK
jgi:glycosyltransferase involved in cell wall biosynthesis